VLDLPVYDDGAHIYSCWQLTPEELEAVGRYGCIFVGVLHGGSGTAPPICVVAPGDISELEADGSISEVA